MMSTIKRIKGRIVLSVVAVVVLLLMIGLPLLLQAEGELSLRWGNIPGGYAISNGDGYRVAGTSGELAAGSISGAGVQMSGGFWGAVEEPPPWIPPAAAMYVLYLPSAIGN